MKYDHACALALLLFFTGCHSIYFHNGEVEKEKIKKIIKENQRANVTQDTVVHTLFELIEVGDPHNVMNNCENNEWKSVMIESTFLDFLISSFHRSILSTHTLREACNE